jgi:hypothetical protein
LGGTEKGVNLSAEKMKKPKKNGEKLSKKLRKNA